MKLMNYLPKLMREVNEMKEITNAEDPEITILFGNTERVLENAFLDTLDGYGCSRWENILEITAKSGSDIDTRRTIIKAALAGDTPYTMRSLERKLGIICGKENFTLEYGKEEYTINITLSLNVKNSMSYIKRMIYYMLPANVIFNINLDINTHRRIGRRRHKELKPYSHSGLRTQYFTGEEN